ncbi:DUF2312 domain-containing protein [Kiloniella antarctica]|uniref:DUF2312 domain-containing protein n=1 Tax=Kiloniella antarctica TaxID=1550907 RepID=A0ABW5BKC7_9PROT
MLTEHDSPTQHLEGQQEAFQPDELRPETSLKALNGGEINGVTADRLRGFIGRVERLEGEKKAIADDIKEIYSEAKSLGFNTKIMRKIVSLRKIEQQERLEQEELIDVYKHAVGMI